MWLRSRNWNRRSLWVTAPKSLVQFDYENAVWIYLGAQGTFNPSTSPPLECIFGHIPFSRRWDTVRYSLAFTRYCCYEYCMVYGIQTGGREGSRILSNNRAVVLHQGEQYRWAGGVKGWLIRAQQPRRKRISCEGQDTAGYSRYSWIPLDTYGCSWMQWDTAGYNVSTAKLLYEGLTPG